MLHNLSREGRTIICTIHQPSAAIYEMFDQVYVLAQGQCVYRGAATSTLSYLGENGLQCPLYHSMADFCKYTKNRSFIVVPGSSLETMFFFLFSYRSQ